MYCMWSKWTKSKSRIFHENLINFTHLGWRQQWCNYNRKIGSLVFYFNIRCRHCTVKSERIVYGKQFMQNILNWKQIFWRKQKFWTRKKIFEHEKEYFQHKEKYFKHKKNSNNECLFFKYCQNWGVLNLAFNSSVTSYSHLL